MTDLVLGVEIAGRHLEVFTRGALFHMMFFLAWSLIYFRLEGRSTTRPSAGRGGDYINRISVDERGQVRTIPVADIECILASGDYIEIHLSDAQFLKKETIAAMEQLLDPSAVSRIHRSTIIKRSAVSAIRPNGNSTYSIHLASGRTVQSSRSYASTIKRISAPQASPAH
jgi:DNA-binding LytR/AlgR family response regulator